MYVVTGATGNVGSELVAALAAAGQRVRALVRTPREVPGAETAVGDLNRPETLEDALSGAQGLFLMPGYEGLRDTLALAADAGVKRVVLLSGGSAAGGDLTNAVARYMIESEQAVRESGLPWTFVRPTAFMSNALRWKDQLAEGDVVRVAFATVRAAPVDPYDIAAVAARALIDDGHEGVIHAVSGPRSLLVDEQIATLGRVLGRDLRCVGLTDAEARAEMEAAMPVAYVDAFFSFYVDGTLDESRVLPTVEQVTGRAPRTFEEWARHHAAAFRRP
ncbi:NAD(P)H-binding protein [Streptomyces sp. V4-01]|uniref:NAD(P)H-binding protein n=1 Tax=Actinacidiphila polyblastidii TaxID=3110430 RepID=A0ABU7PJX6_9ACTN|nr:NAD(P)H-binding protein [Streptomyces sp. V4-01]